MKKYNKLFPSIFVYDEVIDSPNIFINLAKEENNWRPGTVSYVNEFESVIGKERSVNVFDVPNVLKGNQQWFKLSRALWQYGNNYALENKLSFSDMEPPQILWYKPSKDFYESHHDDGPGLNRIFSAVLYLNTVEEGGETIFTNFDISVNPTAGRMIVFPASYPYSHEAKSPQSGDKFAAVTWFRQ